MLQNAYLLAKIGADTAENEQHFAEILPKMSMTPPPFCSARWLHVCFGLGSHTPPPPQPPPNLKARQAKVRGADPAAPEAELQLLEDLAGDQASASARSKLN